MIFHCVSGETNYPTYNRINFPQFMYLKCRFVAYKGPLSLCHNQVRQLNPSKEAVSPLISLDELPCVDYNFLQLVIKSSNKISIPSYYLDKISHRGRPWERKQVTCRPSEFMGIASISHEYPGVKL